VHPQTVPGIRKKGHERQIAELLPEIAFYALEKCIPLIGPPIFLCLEHSKKEALNADREGSADLEVAFPVPPGFRPGTGNERFTLPGGRMARIVHVGPYKASEPTWLKLFSGIERRKE
jgi:AraC family transcriptional regulator